MNELKVGCLIGHGGGDFCDAMPDEINGSRSRKIEIFVSVGIP